MDVSVALIVCKLLSYTDFNIKIIKETIRYNHNLSIHNDLRNLNIVKILLALRHQCTITD